MENVVDVAEVEGLADVLLEELEARLVAQMGDVLACAGEQIVGANDGVALAEQRVAQMRAEKSGAAGYEYAHIGYVLQCPATEGPRLLPLMRVLRNPVMRSHGSSTRSRRIIDRVRLDCLMADREADLLIIGAGIVGLATALEATRRFPKLRLVVVEKENQVAAHQTGHNSGVIHSGLYYKTGSLKARNCVAGAASMKRFCREQRHSLRRVRQAGGRDQRGRSPSAGAIASARHRQRRAGTADARAVSNFASSSRTARACAHCTSRRPESWITSPSRRSMPS